MEIMSANVKSVRRSAISHEGSLMAKLLLIKTVTLLSFC